MFMPLSSRNSWKKISVIFVYLCDISQSQAVIVNLTRLTTSESPGGFFSTEATDVQFLGGFVDSHQLVVIFLYTMFLRF